MPPMLAARFEPNFARFGELFPARGISLVVSVVPMQSSWYYTQVDGYLCIVEGATSVHCISSHAGSVVATGLLPSMRPTLSR
jgi:hypothetical protein